MPGVKGRSGGARAGAGRPPKPPETLSVPPTSDPLDFLRLVMSDPAASARLRIDAAKALMPFVHQKLGETGKKEAKNADARKAVGKFAAAVPPRLVVAGGLVAPIFGTAQAKTPHTTVCK